MRAQAVAASGLAALAVALTLPVLVAAVVAGAPLLAVVPIGGCLAVWSALHEACARPSRRADVRLAAVLAFVAVASVFLVSFGGAFLWLPLVLFAASAVVLPRT